MRCPKCGTISFDHLDRCSKCLTDLTSERLQLNLLGIKPNPISLQEIFDRDAQHFRKKADRKREDISVRSPKGGLPERPEQFLEKGSFLDDPISLDLDRTSKRSMNPKQVNQEIELSLEGLDLSLIPKKDQ